VKKITFLERDVSFVLPQKNCVQCGAKIISHLKQNNGSCVVFYACVEFSHSHLKKTEENYVYVFLCRHTYLFLRVVFSVAVLVVVASFSFKFNNGKEMHVHVIFTREAVCCCH
jgi:hypothetical protein